MPIIKERFPCIYWANRTIYTRNIHTDTTKKKMLMSAIAFSNIPFCFKTRMCQRSADEKCSSQLSRYAIPWFYHEKKTMSHRRKKEGESEKIAYNVYPRGFHIPYHILTSLLCCSSACQPFQLLRWYRFKIRITNIYVSAFSLSLSHNSRRHMR